MRRTAAILIAMVLGVGSAAVLVSPVDAVATRQAGSGYWLVDRGGSVQAIGSVKSCG